MRKKAFLFPYTKNNCDIVKYKELLCSYDIVGIDTLTLELRGKDASYIYNGQPTGMKIGCETLDYDTLLLGDGSYIDNNLAEVYEYAKKAAQNGKNISILYTLTIEQKEKFEQLCSENNVRCHMFSGISVPNELIERESEILNDISVPVIIVNGVAENTGKFEVQLILNEYFKKKGYNVVQIGSKNFCELFGFYSFPQFMFREITEIQKIISFNQLCKGLECQEKPDLFIIGVPGSLMPYNNYFTNKFGVLPFEIGKAIKADAVVMALDNAPYEKVGLDKINQICTVYYGNEVTAFSMSNFRIDVEKSIQEKSLGYIISDKESVEKNKERIKDNVELYIYNSLERTQLEELCKYIEADLSDMDIKLL